MDYKDDDEPESNGKFHFEGTIEGFESFFNEFSSPENEQFDDSSKRFKSRRRHNHRE